MTLFSRAAPFDFSEHRMPGQLAAISSPYGPDADAGFFGGRLSSRFSATGIFDGRTRDTIAVLQQGAGNQGYVAALAGVALHGDFRVVQPVAVGECSIDIEVELFLVDFDFSGEFPEIITVGSTSSKRRITDMAVPGARSSFTGETYFVVASMRLRPHMNIAVRVSLLQTIKGGVSSRSAVVEQKIRGDVRVIEGISLPQLGILSGPNPFAYDESNQPV